MKPQSISGFPELLPGAQAWFEDRLQALRTLFRRYAFVPLETASVERVEVLSAKGVADKEIYRLARLRADDHGHETEYALHFDLTVPLARYVSQHQGRLTFPFKRYQIQKVWRGERPQKGRYREFYQCDLDVIGAERLEPHYEAEVLVAMHHALVLLETPRHRFRINSRPLIEAVLTHFGFASDTHTDAVRILDTLAKVPGDVVHAQLTPLASGAAADEVLALLATNPSLERLREVLPAQALHLLESLQRLSETLIAFGMPESAFGLDLSIARGLDYYTGTVFECVSTDSPELGSICSGGRYDNLTGRFQKRAMPGFGASIGLSRLLLPRLEAPTDTDRSPVPLVVCVANPMAFGVAAEATRILREAGFTCELLPHHAKLGNLIRRAEQLGATYALLAFEAEAADGAIVIKRLADAHQETLRIEHLAEHLSAQHVAREMPGAQRDTDPSAAQEHHP